MSVEIHPTAIVDPKAELSDGVVVGPFCNVGPHVKIGKNTHLVSHVSLTGDTTLGKECMLYPYVAMGHPPQDFKHKGGSVRIIVGDRNIFREQVNIHPGTDAGKRDTIIGNDCYMMVGSHLAHECHMGNNVVVSNGAQIGGCVSIDDHAILGGLCAIHQFCRIGAHAFVGAMALVTTDVIPYGSAVGNTAYLAGLNVIGLKRRGFERQSIHDLRSGYKLLFSNERTFAERFEDAAKIHADHPLVMDVVAFIRANEKRPICMPHSGR